MEFTVCAATRDYIRIKSPCLVSLGVDHDRLEAYIAQLGGIQHCFYRSANGSLRLEVMEGFDKRTLFELFASHDRASLLREIKINTSRLYEATPRRRLNFQLFFRTLATGVILLRGYLPPLATPLTLALMSLDSVIRLYEERHSRHFMEYLLDSVSLAGLFLTFDPLAPAMKLWLDALEEWSVQMIPYEISEKEIYKVLQLNDKEEADEFVQQVLGGTALAYLSSGKLDIANTLLNAKPHCMMREWVPVMAHKALTELHFNGFEIDNAHLLPHIDACTTVVVEDGLFIPKKFETLKKTVIAAHQNPLLKKNRLYIKLFEQEGETCVYELLINGKSELKLKLKSSNIDMVVGALKELFSVAQRYTSARRSLDRLNYYTSRITFYSGFSGMVSPTLAAVANRSLRSVAAREIALNS